MSSKIVPFDPSHASKGVVAKIRSALGTIAQIFFRIDSWDVFMGVEHMSQGKYAGKISLFAMKKTIALLKEIEEKESPNSEKRKEISAAREKLEFAAHIEAKTMNPLIPSSVIGAEIKEKVKSLSVGDSIAIPCTVHGHAMLMEIACTGEGKYRVVVHNTGDGISSFHPMQFLEGKQQFQTGLIIDDVSSEKLCGENADFFSKVARLELAVVGSSPKVLYGLVGSLGGKVTIEPDVHLWSHGQIGGSCTVSCLNSFLRSKLSQTTYKDFREKARFDVLNRSISAFESGEARTPTRARMMIDVIDKLLSRETISQIDKENLQKTREALTTWLEKNTGKKESSFLPSLVTRVERGAGFLFGAMKLRPQESLRAQASTELPASEEKASQIQGAKDLLVLLKTKSWNLKEIEQECEKFTSLPPISSESELKELLRIFEKILQFAKDSPLSKEQIHIMAGVKASLNEVLIDFLGREDSFFKEYNKKIKDLINKRNILYINFLATTDLEKENWGFGGKLAQIPHKLSGNLGFTEGRVDIPKGLKRLYPTTDTTHCQRINGKSVYFAQNRQGDYRPAFSISLSLTALCNPEIDSSDLLRECSEEGESKQLSSRLGKKPVIWPDFQSEKQQVVLHVPKEYKEAFCKIDPSLSLTEEGDGYIATISLKDNQSAFFDAMKRWGLVHSEIGQENSLGGENWWKEEFSDVSEMAFAVPRETHMTGEASLSKMQQKIEAFNKKWVDQAQGSVSCSINPETKALVYVDAREPSKMSFFETLRRKNPDAFDLTREISRKK